MKQIDVPGKLFRLQPNRYCDTYEGKTVEFIYDLDGKLVLLIGRFMTRIRLGLECLDIHYTGRLDPHDKPQTSYVFQLSRAHLRSTVPADKPGSTVDFLMERPLLARECMKSAFEDERSETEIRGYQTGVGRDSRF
jgi:hypothetical protein